MKRLLMLTVISGLVGTVGVRAEVIDSPVYEGNTNSAVSIRRGEEWSARNATFENNSSNYGGAIDNNSFLYLYGDNVFKNNSGYWGGGAILNGGIAYLLGNNVFEGNSSASFGGALFSQWYTILQPENEADSNVFKDNKAYEGGAIAHMAATLFVNRARFINNSAEDTRDNIGAINAYNRGGAIEANGDKHFILNSEFRKNHAYAGGAILTGFAQGLLGTPDTEFGGLTLYNTSFYDNKAVDKGGALAASGAAIIAAGENGVSEFKGNGLDDGKKQAIYMTNEYGSGSDDVNPKLVLKTYNGGKIIVHDDIDGENYDIEISGGVTDNLTDEVIDEEMKEEVGDVLAGVSGEGNGEVYLLGKVDHVKNFMALAGSMIHLGANAVINAVNYKSDNAILKLDVTTGEDNKTLHNGIINVSGDVEGTTNVIVNLEKPVVDAGAAIKFLDAPNDKADTPASFNIARVIGSPYMWDSAVNHKGETEGNHWYLTLGNEENPDYENPDIENPDAEKPTFAPEIAAFAGIQSAVIEQNRSVTNSIVKGLAVAHKQICHNTRCGKFEILPKKQAWITTTHENADIKAPADMEAKINGVTIGVDLYRTRFERAGVFGTYRHGKYDLSGKGNYYSALSSDITDESWLGGLYYNRNCNSWLLLATLFAGRQNLDLKTTDGVVSADTASTQYGLSARVGKKIALNNYWNITPEAGVYYSIMDTDRIRDNVGKGAEFDTLRYAEAEFGVKFGYQFCANGCSNSLYFKPSIIRTFANGRHSRLFTAERVEKVKVYEDRTLGRAEFGDEFGISSKFSGFARAGYTFGDAYHSYDLLFGVSYLF